MKLKSRLNRKRRLAVVGASLALGALSLAAVALADDVTNDLDVTVDATAEVMNLSAGGANGSTNLSVVPRTGDGKNGCNIQSTDPAVTFSVASSSPAVATVSPSSVAFDNCGDVNQLSVTPLTQGTTTISLTQTTNTSAGTWNAAPATFTVNVGAAAVTNNAPVVGSAASDADGIEGDLLTASGSFTDSDGDSLSLSANNGEGTFTDNGDGTWSWSLQTSDDVTGGTITVMADDGNGGTATDEFHYSAANANPTIDNLTKAGTDCDPSVSFDVNDVGTADTESGTIDWGDSSTDDAFGPALAGTSFGPYSHHYGSAGTRTVTVDAADDDGGAAQSATTSVTVHNVPSGILQPINNTGPRSAFKLGSTIPVKIAVQDCNGNAVSSLAPSVKLQKVDVNNDPDGTDIEPVSTANPTSGTTMRWDSSGQQYIYNLATKGLALANYMVFVSDPSFASPVIAVITLKK